MSATTFGLIGIGVLAAAMLALMIHAAFFDR